MGTLAEIENAVNELPRPEQEILLRRLSDKLGTAVRGTWPVPPPNVPREEVRRIQAEIDAAFSHPEGIV
jgi:hypothetical protein